MIFFFSNSKKGRRDLEKIKNKKKVTEWLKKYGGVGAVQN